MGTGRALRPVRRYGVRGNREHHGPILPDLRPGAAHGRRHLPALSLRRARARPAGTAAERRVRPGDRRADRRGLAAPHRSRSGGAGRPPRARGAAPDREPSRRSAARDAHPRRLMALQVALIQPQIPPNTGNIARLCAATGTALHLIEPLGFTLGDSELKRAGLDYWDGVDLWVHPDWFAFRDAMARSRCLYF